MALFPLLTYLKGLAAIQVGKFQESIKSYGTSGYNTFPITDYIPGLISTKQYAQTLWLKKVLWTLGQYDSYLRVANVP